MECDDNDDLNEQGWTAFALLMAAHLLKDLIKGSKMVLLSSKQRHDHKTRTRFFLGGWLLIAVTSFTLYASTIYNAAIATSKQFPPLFSAHCASKLILST